MRLFDLSEAEEVTVEEFHNCFFHLMYSKVEEEEQTRLSLQAQVKEAQSKNKSLKYYKKIEKHYFDKNFDSYVMYISLIFDIRKLPPYVDIRDRSLSPNIKKASNSFLSQAQVASYYANILNQHIPQSYNLGMQASQNYYNQAQGMMNSNPYTNQPISPAIVPSPNFAALLIDIPPPPTTLDRIKGFLLKWL